VAAVAGDSEEWLARLAPAQARDHDALQQRVAARLQEAVDGA
jgi:hypothetical protein